MHYIKAAFVAILITAPCFAFTFTIRTRNSFVDRHGSKLYMVGEIVEGANAALNALPLLAGPTAALAAGQVALSQKKKIESEVEFAERELDDVKRRLKNTDTLINVSKLRLLYVHFDNFLLTLARFQNVNLGFIWTGSCISRVCSCTGL
jgi:hypothetical protein